MSEQRRLSPQIWHRAGLFCLLCLLLSFASPSQADLYPFHAPEDYLAPAAEMTNWAATLERHNAQRPWLVDCTQGDRGCRGRLGSLGRVLEKARALDPEAQLKLVNFYINRTKYKDDRPQRRYDAAGRKIGVQRSSWTTLYDFLARGGDCEDYATAKYFMLRELGWSADDMKVLVVWEVRERGHHGLLAVRQPDGGVWLLDSDNRIRKTQHRGYRYLYAMNEASVWDHRPDFDAQAP